MSYIWKNYVNKVFENTQKNEVMDDTNIYKWY